MTLSVHSVFATLQGEGSQVGRPAVFVRLSGCNLWSGDPDRREGPGSCAAWCDTEFRGGAATGVELVVGAIADDQAEYDDCRPEFFDAVRVATGLRIVAPLIGLSKAHVVDMAENYEIREEETWSCYGPGPLPCGTCPSCKLRTSAS